MTKCLSIDDDVRRILWDRHQIAPGDVMDAHVLGLDSPGGRYLGVLATGCGEVVGIEANTLDALRDLMARVPTPEPTVYLVWDHDTGTEVPVHVHAAPARWTPTLP